LKTTEERLGRNQNNCEPHSDDLASPPLDTTPFPSYIPFVTSPLFIPSIPRPTCSESYLTSPADVSDFVSRSLEREIDYDMEVARPQAMARIAATGSA
jgi:hypothetical protein